MIHSIQAPDRLKAAAVQHRCISTKTFMNNFFVLYNLFLLQVDKRALYCALMQSFLRQRDPIFSRIQQKYRTAK